MQFTIRPSGSERAPFRVNLTAVSLLSLKLRSGDLCALYLPEDTEPTKIAIAWENSSSGMKDTIVQTSRTLQELYGFTLKDKVTIQRIPEKLEDSVQVILRTPDSISESEQQHYRTVAAATVSQHHDVLAPSQKIVIEIDSKKVMLEVVSVGGLLGRITKQTSFVIEHAGSKCLPTTLSLEFPKVGGLAVQIERIRTFVELFTSPDIPQRWPGYEPSRGLLLFGAKGTGKSLLLNAIAAESGWSSVKHWIPGVKIPRAHGLQLVTLQFEEFAITDSTTRDLAALFASIQGSSTMVVATVRRRNDVPERLRSEGLFETEIELPVPDVIQRLDILKVFREVKGRALEPNDNLLSGLASRTHGFVGGDLKILLKEIWNMAFSRHKHLLPVEMSEIQRDSIEEAYVTDVDIENALQQVRPSALQEIFLEKPNVRWSDIGGQHDIKKRLKDAIEMPLKYPDQMKSYGVMPTKGVLLYGPPGCSKTLTVKALATEADYNFLAVKGAELISMYVGESEKATREIFRKARQASPSIIFFDEIDAIASRGRSGSDLQVLTTLLNEMDGFEELRNVMVVAATNKPESIDPALMRPGRFDSVVYVGPPDLDARKDIFDKKFANVKVTEEVRNRTADFAQQTEGFSGAEIVAICQSAGLQVLSSGGQGSITVDHVLQAVSRTPKGITPEMLRSYQEWSAKRAR